MMHLCIFLHLPQSSLDFATPESIRNRDRPSAVVTLDSKRSGVRFVMVLVTFSISLNGIVANRYDVGHISLDVAYVSIDGCDTSASI